MSGQSLNLKTTFSTYKEECHKYFLKQGVFNTHHSKNIDLFIKKVYEFVLEEYFEDFFFNIENIPFCILANGHYARMNLSANEDLKLLFIYKDIKIFNLKPMIKNLIEVLNDMGIKLDYEIYELDGLKNFIQNDECNVDIRLIIGSKILFKQIRNHMENLIKHHKQLLFEKLFSKIDYHFIPFIPQEFNINKDCGGLNELNDLENLLLIFKNSPQNYALNFIDAHELSEFRLASDFLFSLKSAMSLQNQRDEENFLLDQAHCISSLMHKKDQKNLNAKDLLVQKALSSMHVTGLYVRFLTAVLQKEFYMQKKSSYYFKNIIDALKYLQNLPDEKNIWDIELVFALKRISLNKSDLEKSFEVFQSFFYRRHSFDIFKILLDSEILKDLCKPLSTVRFLGDDESDYSFDEQAFLTLAEFEQQEDKFEFLKNLSNDEKMILKFVILLSGINLENEISMANIYRAYCAKFSIKTEILELGLKLFKNHNALKELVEKEDIYDPIVVCALLSKVEDLKTLEFLYYLTLIKARALHCKNFFFDVLDKLLENAKEGFKDENLLDETARRVKKELTLKRTKMFLELNSLLQDKILHIKSNLFLIKNTFEEVINVSKIANENKLKFWFGDELNLSLHIVSSRDFNLEIFLLLLAHFNLNYMSFYELYEDKIYLKFDYDNIVDDAQREKLKQLLNSNLQNGIKKKIKKPIIKKDELKLDLDYSKFYAKLNLNTKDQQGLMAYVINVFNYYHLNLCEAKIQTIRQRTRNIFIFQKNDTLLKNEKEFLNSLISG